MTNLSCSCCCTSARCACEGCSLRLAGLSPMSPWKVAVQAGVAGKSRSAWRRGRAAAWAQAAWRVARAAAPAAEWAAAWLMSPVGRQAAAEVLCGGSQPLGGGALQQHPADGAMQQQQQPVGGNGLQHHPAAVPWRLLPAVCCC
eukprot:363464-Chlamydomonas_euryale.AAC.4